MCSSVVGKPSAEIDTPAVAVGNNSADRELIGSLGLKCRSTAGELQPHPREGGPLTEAQDAEAAPNRSKNKWREMALMEIISL
jgi:hypothetical protein